MATSGMKVLVNGGINLSELDGWWAEAYTPEVGWALGDGLEHGEDPAWDAVEANALYDLLEREVAPQFYSRDYENIPRAWVAQMRESMARQVPRFSANRSVRQYTQQYDLPAAENYRARAADGGQVTPQIEEWLQNLDQKWNALRFGEIQVETKEAQHEFQVEVSLGDLDPDAVRVELYANGIGGEPPARKEIKRGQRLESHTGDYTYRVAASAARAARDYTAWIVLRRDDVAVPLEAPYILWQR